MSERKFFNFLFNEYAQEEPAKIYGCRWESFDEMTLWLPEDKVWQLGYDLFLKKPFAQEIVLDGKDNFNLQAVLEEGVSVACSPQARVCEALWGGPPKLPEILSLKL